ncbi:MAG: GDP-mannose 4,6-dehydratase [Chlamydiae bacterium]|nr:GDP-mannose 4,6-dehydratase [Chlamydiota bacterium]MBI3277325.1 GDP-mannose 4,6-dehydratase [Chlamydiota bacterium]
MRTLVIGGAGFIGSNLAYEHLKRRDDVTILDNFSRKGAELNLKWLKSISPHMKVIRADIRYHQSQLEKAVSKADLIYHMAAQVAVTTSVQDPRMDFEMNALGTFNVLEAIRKKGEDPILFFASTNKVYGKMEDLSIHESVTRYQFPASLKNGIDENQGLDFYSPYGCSKGAADQYVLDYARIYGLRTVVFRQSCIYGSRQFGIEDQGWIAWFIIALVLNKPITIYGDGKQVRDVLYIEDLVRAFQLARKAISRTKGQAFNIGGGPHYTLSVWKEFCPILEKVMGKKIKASYDQARPGDQLVYVSNIKKAKKYFGWEPQIPVEKGIHQLYRWVLENKNLLMKIF